jgi:hypothetical protein
VAAFGSHFAGNDQGGVGTEPERGKEGPLAGCERGFSQITVATAAGYGVGNGENSEWNIQATLAALCDRATAIDLGARHLANCLDYVDEILPGLGAEQRELQGLITYNSGGPQVEGNWYWHQYMQNIENYIGCLAWAREIVG